MAVSYHADYFAVFCAPCVRLHNGVGPRADCGYCLLRVQLQIRLVEYKPPVAAKDDFRRAFSAKVVAFHAMFVEYRLYVFYV